MNSSSDDDSYLFQPNNGAMVQPTDMAQIKIILSMAVFLVSGWALNPFTITLYRSKAMNVMVQIDPQPKRDPNMPYSSQKNGPGNGAC